MRFFDGSFNYLRSEGACLCYWICYAAFFLIARVMASFRSCQRVVIAIFVTTRELWILRSLWFLLLTWATIHRVFFFLFYYLSIHQRLAFCILFEILFVFNLRIWAWAVLKSRLWWLTFFIAIMLTFLITVIRVFIFIYVFIGNLSSSRFFHLMFPEFLIIDVAGSFTILIIVNFRVCFLALWRIKHDLRLWSLNRDYEVCRGSLRINRHWV